LRRQREYLGRCGVSTDWIYPSRLTCAHDRAEVIHTDALDVRAVLDREKRTKQVCDVDVVSRPFVLHVPTRHNIFDLSVPPEMSSIGKPRAILDQESNGKVREQLRVGRNSEQ
jgi:hypothetical protein